MLPKYICKNCGFKRWYQVSRYNQFIGIATIITVRCKECGEQVDITKDVIESICCDKLVKQDKKRMKTRKEM